MINQDPNPTPSSTITSISMVPIGGVAAVLRSGDAYKAVGEVVSRTTYPALSTAFPRNGSYASVSVSYATPSTFEPFSIASNGTSTIQVGSANAGNSTTTYRISFDGGKSWQFRGNLPSAGIWSTIIYANGKYTAFSQSKCAISTDDGATWAEYSMPSSSAHGWSAAYSATLGIYVAVSIDRNTANNVAASSTDAQSWAARTMPSTQKWTAVAEGNGVFVAVSDSATPSTAAASSTNGTSWAAQTMPNAGGWRSVTYATNVNKFVAVGTSQGQGGLVATSGNGTSWTDKTSQAAVQLAIPGLAYQDHHSVAYGNGVVHIVGTNGLRLVSYDCQKFKLVTGAGTQLFKGALGTAGNGAGLTVFASTGFMSFLTGNSGNVDVGTGSIYVSNQVEISYAENLTDSDLMYLSGTAGQFIRVK